MNNFKTLILILVFPFISVLTFAQNKETRQLNSFKKLHVGGSYNVVLEQGGQESVRLEGRNIDLNKVITEVKNNELHVYLEKGNYNNFDLTVYVNYKNLEEIHKSGSGNLTAESDINASNLKLHFSGSGNTKLQSLNANDIKVHLSGSGNVTLGGGKAQNLEINQSGSGNIKSEKLTAETCSIQKSGSGNVHVNVNKTLEVSSSGSGNVKYSGNPSINRVKFSGSGELIKG